MSNLNQKQVSEIAAVIESNAIYWSRPVSSVDLTDRYVTLHHADGRTTKYRWDENNNLRLFS